jgi:hypothetical protein
MPAVHARWTTASLRRAVTVVSMGPGDGQVALHGGCIRLSCRGSTWLPRPYWKGHLRISLVAAPETLYSATQASATIHLNQLHEKCGSRIRYVKTCPVHGEVTNDEIVSGYDEGIHADPQSDGG